MVEPDSNIVDEEIISVLNCCAVISPVTKRDPVTDATPVVEEPLYPIQVGLTSICFSAPELSEVNKDSCPVVTSTEEELIKFLKLSSISDWVRAEPFVILRVIWDIIF